MAAFVVENGTLLRYGGRGGKVVVPCGVKHIGMSAFANSAVTEVVIPRGVETVDFGAFMGCEHLKRVRIGYGMTSVGAYAFSESGLESVILPASVKEIGYCAFEGCESLKSAKAAGTDAIGATVFRRCPALRTLTVSPRCILEEEALPEACNVVRR